MTSLSIAIFKESTERVVVGCFVIVVKIGNSALIFVEVICFCKEPFVFVIELGHG
jgi:hypothetical protein